MEQFVRQMVHRLRLAQARAQMIGGLEVAVAEQDEAERVQTVEAVCAGARWGELRRGAEAQSEVMMQESAELMHQLGGYS